MKELIDKATVVAEIERLREQDYPCDTFEESTGYYNALDEIATFLNTLEVKEVDCDKEIGMYTTKELLRKRNKFTDVFHLTQGDIDRIAKHFFELGIKAKKGE